MAAARRGAYRVEKRQKEIRRLKKQAEKRARQQHKNATTGVAPEGSADAADAAESPTPGDDAATTGDTGQPESP